jgi:hypothetical protein
VVIVLVVFPGALKPSVLIGLPRLSDTTTLFTGLVRCTARRSPRSSPIPTHPWKCVGIPSCRRLPHALGLAQTPTKCFGHTLLSSLTHFRRSPTRVRLLPTHIAPPAHSAPHTHTAPDTGD